MHAAQKFERFVETYRRPDGGRWGGQDLHEATGGVVTRSYVSNLRKGRIENPGYEKLTAIAKAMGFPPALWFEDRPGDGASTRAEDTTIAARVEHLFGAVRNPSTGKPYTAADVARTSAGDLTDEDVEGIRGGEVPDPTVGQVAALARAFGVPPSYLLDRGEPPLDEGLMEALGDETVRATARESVGLPERERKMLLGIARQFGEARDRPEGKR